MGLTVSGEEPAEGWVKLENNQVIDYSLKFNDYVVNYDDDKIEVTKNEIIEEATGFVLQRFFYGVGYYSANSVKNNPVYYNPVTGQKCNVNDANENYHEDNSIAGYNGITTNGNVSNNTDNNTGCLKWYKYSVNKDGTVNMILDHNTSVGVQWYTSYDNSKAAETALVNMNGVLSNGNFTTVGDTSGWIGVPARNDKYEAKWFNGTSNKTSTIDYTGYKARLITAQEVANIIGKKSWNEVFNDLLCFGSASTTEYFQQNNYQKAIQQSYSWLFDNLYDSANNGGTKSQEINANYSYWTSSPGNISYHSVWVVDAGGRLSGSYITNFTGVRPVITISK